MCLCKNNPSQAAENSKNTYKKIRVLKSPVVYIVNHFFFKVCSVTSVDHHHCQSSNKDLHALSFIVVNYKNH